MWTLIPVLAGFAATVCSEGYIFFGLDESVTNNTWCCESCRQQAGTERCCCSHPHSNDWYDRNDDFLCRILREYSWRYYAPEIYGEPFEDYANIINMAHVVSKFKLNAFAPPTTCPPGNLIALLMSAELALRAIWPLIKSQSDREALSPTIRLAGEYYNQARVLLNELVTKDPIGLGSLQIEWPVTQAFSMCSKLFTATEITNRVPNISPVLYQYSHVLGEFYDVLVHPTDPQTVLIYEHDARQQATAPLEYKKEAFLQFVSVLEETNVIFFPVKGTLIGLLRYGSTVGNLPHGRVDEVDDDFDFWVQVPYDDRIRWASDFFVRLVKLGWGRCSFDGEFPYHAEVYRARRLVRIMCFKFEPHWFMVDIIFFESFGEDQIVWTKVCNPHDLPPPEWPIYYDRSTTKNCSVFPNPSWVRAVWAGTPHRIPASVIFPLSKCFAFGREVPCPGKPVEFLHQTFADTAKQSGDAYDDPVCLAFPYITHARPCDEQQHSLMSHWTIQDDLVIRESIRKLNESGYASFAPIMNTDACRRPQLGCPVSQRWLDHCSTAWTMFHVSKSSEVGFSASSRQ